MPHKKLFIYLFIYQLFWTQAWPEGMCTNGTQVPCEVPSLLNPTTRNYVGHTTGIHDSYSFPIVMWIFYVPQEQIRENAVRRDLRFLVLIRED